MNAQVQVQDTDDLDDHTPLDDVGILTENVMKLVDHPEEVYVEEGRNSEGATVLTIHVDYEDRGRVIGAHGANINLLRNLMGIFAARQRKRIILEVAGTRPRGRRERRKARV